MKHRLLYNQRSPLVVRRENAALTNEAETSIQPEEPGVYFFNVNIHTWNFRETHLHLMLHGSVPLALNAPQEEREDVSVTFTGPWGPQ